MYKNSPDLLYLRDPNDTIFKKFQNIQIQKRCVNLFPNNIRHSPSKCSWVYEVLLCIVIYLDSILISQWEKSFEYSQNLFTDTKYALKYNPVYILFNRILQFLTSYKNEIIQEVENHEKKSKLFEILTQIYNLEVINLENIIDNWIEQIKAFIIKLENESNK